MFDKTFLRLDGVNLIDNSLKQWLFKTLILKSNGYLVCTAAAWAADSTLWWWWWWWSLTPVAPTLSKITNKKVATLKTMEKRESIYIKDSKKKYYFNFLDITSQVLLELHLKISEK